MDETIQQRLTRIFQHVPDELDLRLTRAVTAHDVPAGGSLSEATSCARYGRRACRRAGASRLDGASVLRLLGATALTVLLLMAFTPLVNLWAYWLAPPRTGVDSVEAIVVLGAGGVTSGGALTDKSLHGALQGIALYRRGAAPLVVFSGTRLDASRDEASARAELARECGLPASAVLISSAARTTREEAVQVGNLLRARGISKVMLVADGPGLPRAMRSFQRVGFVVVPEPSAGELDLGGGPEDRLNLLRQIAIETVARAYYRLVGFF